MEIPGAATPEFCEQLIKRFEADGRKGTARIGPEGAEDKKVRDSTNLEMNLLDDWSSTVDDIRQMIFSRLTKYLDDVHTGLSKSMFVNGYDSSYTMMKYVPGSVGYTWHNDFLFDDFSNKSGVRTVTWLFYLNDADGGETEFKYGRKIKCETGKLVLFPSCWSMVHRGLPVNSGVKYLCVGWIYSTWNQGISNPYK